ncbi:hypothetical protein NWP10_02805 [Micrococcus sp. HG099]|uniref:hypothetical protein n=1 Tax=Micrococcus sp. HG099 TaxID=2969755 RepID=UPI00215ABF5E|nr:hypothetical protein [Micrococcus sp. HG099]MCR8674740.1 hypothetical protein [Micrococcus sp. HG099]
MMFGGDMMRDLMVGSGWLGLLACMVLGGIARLPLAAAGTRRAEGRPWAVQGVLGFGRLGPRARGSAPGRPVAGLVPARGRGRAARLRRAADVVAGLHTV